MAKIANWKKKKVEDIKKLLISYKVIGIADMTNLPSPQLQKIRSSLKGQVLITMTKTRLIKLAIQQLKDSKKNIEELSNIITGIPALILTNIDAFHLSKSLSKRKTKAPAKPGQKSPDNIIVPAGPTSFPPGPIMGELGQFGIKTIVSEGKINIKEDKLLVKENEIITDKVASLLQKLKIEPMEIGINLLGAYEDGLIYKRDVLLIDEKTYKNDMITVYNNAFNLSIFINYPTKENIAYLIQRAYREIKALSNLKSISILEEKKAPENEIDDKEKKAQKEKEEFKKQEQHAKEILNKMQEERMKNPVEVNVEEPKINKGPKIEDLVPKDYD